MEWQSLELTGKGSERRDEDSRSEGCATRGVDERRQSRERKGGDELREGNGVSRFGKAGLRAAKEERAGDGQCQGTGQIRRAGISRGRD